MPLIEIEDQYLPQLQGLGVPIADRTHDYRKAKDFETFVETISKDPKHRDHLLQAAEEKMGVVSPELQRVRQVREEFNSLLDDRLKPLNEFLDDQKKKAEEDRTKSTEKLINDGRSFLREDGWDDDGVKEVETFMRDHAVGDYRVASAYLKKQKPEPTTLPSTSWNGGDFGSQWFTPQEDAPDHKLLLQNPNA